jgi:plasmid stabilization system protein ParE
MARKVIWSLLAQSDRKNILDYWRKRNQSDAYSRKLNGLFKEAIHIIQEYPQIGKKTNLEGVRIKIVKDYLIIYELSDSFIYILTIWDSRQEPEKLDKIISKS